MTKIDKKQVEKLPQEHKIKSSNTYVNKTLLGFGIKSRVCMQNLFHSFHKPILFVTGAFGSKLYNFLHLEIVLHRLKIS